MKCACGCVKANILCYPTVQVMAHNIIVIMTLPNLTIHIINSFRI